VAQTDRRTQAEDAAERLDRAWDDLLAAPAGDPTSPDGHPGGPADGLVLSVRRLHALDDAPAPDPTSGETDEQDTPTAD
jgi:hypothetical protein